MDISAWCRDEGPAAFRGGSDWGNCGRLDDFGRLGFLLKSNVDVPGMGGFRVRGPKYLCDGRGALAGGDCPGGRGSIG